jgi:gamma-glutamyltranspeptidase/glutathione hydrolase
MRETDLFARVGAHGRRALWWLPSLGVASFLALAHPTGAAEKVRSRGATRAATTEHPLATRAALDVMAKGGNAADAIAAAALVAGVVNPSSSGIGGGGFALVYRPGDASASVLDFRESAPRGLDPEAFEHADGADQRGQLVGVPGEVSGLFELVRRFGKLRWTEVVAPAEAHARRGFAVGAHLARTLAESQKALGVDPNLAALYFPGARARVLGAMIQNPKLANTLRRIGAEGPPALLDGTIGAELAATAESAGGRLTVEDLRGYRVRDRQPLQSEWAGHTVFTMPPPSAGGILLLQTAAMLPADELKRLGWNSGAYHHMIAEAFRAGWADRLENAGDPDVVNVNVAKLLDAKRLAERKKLLAIDRTHSIPLFVSREHGTHHLNVIDESGMTIALTTTVNRVFGAKLVAPESGVVLNDQLADFTLRSEYAPFGITNGPNLPRPLARPVSSMTPTIAVRDNQAVLAIGGSGGTTIPTNVTQLFLARLAFGKSPEVLAKTPRFYVFARGATLVLDPGAPQALEEDLTRRGEKLGTMTFSAHAVQMIARDPDGLKAAADPRKFGAGEVR